MTCERDKWTLYTTLAAHLCVLLVVVLLLVRVPKVLFSLERR